MPSLKAFLTTYNPDHPVGEYGSEVWAYSWKEARETARRRGINEKVIGSKAVLRAQPASVVLRSKKVSDLDRIHALSFMGYLALSAGVAKPSDILGDAGLLHTMVHIALGIETIGPVMGGREITISKRVMMELLVQRCREIERKIPGYPRAK